METKTLLLIIDPQVDFISGSLPVPGAEKAMDKLARWIENCPVRIDDILVTLDSHPSKHVSFKSCWSWDMLDDSVVNKITRDTADHFKFWGNYEERKRAEEYIKNLNKDLYLWPDHCVIGTPGHCIYGPLLNALNSWNNRSTLNWSTGFMEKTDRSWKILMKGNDVCSEMLSAVNLGCSGYYQGGLGNTPVIDKKFIDYYDTIYIAGIARDFCVARTLEDILKYFPDTIPQQFDGRYRKFKLISECLPYINEEIPEVFNILNNNWRSIYYQLPLEIDAKNLSEVVREEHMNTDGDLPCPIEDYISMPLEDAESLFSDIPGFEENSVKHGDWRLGSTCFIKKDWVNSVTTPKPEEE